MRHRSTLYQVICMPLENGNSYPVYITDSTYDIVTPVMQSEYQLSIGLALLVPDIINRLERSISL
jgi:hypothetical protein